MPDPILGYLSVGRRVERTEEEKQISEALLSEFKAAHPPRPDNPILKDMSRAFQEIFMPPPERRKLP